MINKKSFCSHFVVLLFGFFLCSALSIYASKYYAYNLMLSLVRSHETEAIKNFKANDLEQALFHFQSVDYLIKINEDLTIKKDSFIKKNIDGWSLFFPLIGSLGNYVSAGISWKDAFPSIFGSTTAFYAYTLERNGKLEEAEEKYKEALTLLELEGIFNNIEKVKEHARLVLLANETPPISQPESS